MVSEKMTESFFAMVYFFFNNAHFTFICPESSQFYGLLK